MSSPSTHTLRVGDVILVDRGGEEVEMMVTMIAPPMSAGRARSAGPRVTASRGPGGYSVTFDDHSTFLSWRRRDLGRGRR